jgi:glycosyltransferase involved in cell wall biosynthesis
MRLAYCCHDRFPSADTNTQQVFWTLYEVARLGASVDLLVPSLDVAAGRSGTETVAEYYGAPASSVPARLAMYPAGALSRGALAKGWFDWRAPIRLARGAYDLVWTRDPVALASAVKHRLPAVFETYRPDFAAALRFAPWRRAALRSRWLRGVIAHSRVAADAFRAAGVSEGRCLVAHNGFAPALMEPRLDRAAARHKLGLPQDEQLVVYTGHVGPRKGSAALVRTAARVPGARMVIVCVDNARGQGAWLEALAREAGARNLLLVPRVPLADVAAFLYAADCLIVPPTGEPLRLGRTVLPMKIFAYLAAGRPILAPRLPDIEEVLTDGATARLVAPDDEVGAATALKELLGTPALGARLGERARALAAEYTWEARAKRVLEFLRRIRLPLSAGEPGPQGDDVRSAAAASASSRP